MTYFDPLCPIFTGLLFLDWILWWQTKGVWKKLSILLDDKFHEFSFGKIRFSIGFHLLNLWAFAVPFPNGGSTCITQCQDENFWTLCSMYFSGHFSNSAAAPCRCAFLHRIRNTTFGELWSNGCDKKTCKYNCFTVIGQYGIRLSIQYLLNTLKLRKIIQFLLNIATNAGGFFHWNGISFHLNRFPHLYRLWVVTLFLL